MHPRPFPPALVDQSARPTQLVPTLAGAPLWTYGITYGQDLIAQDDVIVTASFNDSTALAAAYAFSTRLAYRTESDGAIFLDTLTLTAAQASPSPSNQWPNAVYLSPDGAVVPLMAGTPTGSTVVYQFPSDTMPVSAWTTITLEYPGLPMATVQNARASLTVRPLPPVGAPSALVPRNIWREPFDITGEGTTPANALQSVFLTLFGPLEGGSITLRIAFAYQVSVGSAGDDGLVVTVPVALFSNVAPGPGTADAAGTAMRDWEAHNPLPGTGREWIFSLAFYSGIDGLSVPPLLTLDRLVYRIDRQPSPAQPIA